jgi:hypothetical protein
MKFPLPGPLGEAHSACPSLLAVSKPMLNRVEGFQSVTAPIFIPVIWRTEGGLCISYGMSVDFNLPRSWEMLHDLPQQLCQLFR